MTLTMAELAGLGFRFDPGEPISVQGRRPGWVQVSQAGRTQWVRESAYRGIRQRQAGAAWWGDQDPYSQGVGADPPFDPRLGRPVRNIREWRDLEAAKERAGIPPGVKSASDWRRHAQERREASRTRRSSGPSWRERRDFARGLKSDSTHEEDIADLDARRNDDTLPAWKRRLYDREYRRRRALKRARERAKAARDARKAAYEKQQKAQGPAPKRWTTPRVTSTRYRSPGASRAFVSSGGTTVTRVSTPGTFVASGGRTVTRPTSTGGALRVAPHLQNVYARQVRSGVATGGPTASVAYGVGGLSGLG